MLAQVSDTSIILYRTLIKNSTVHPKQVNYVNSLLRQIRVLVA